MRASIIHFLISLLPCVVNSQTQKIAFDQEPTALLITANSNTEFIPYNLQTMLVYGEVSDSLNLQEKYSMQAKDYKTASTVLIVTGGALMGVGLIMSLKSFEDCFFSDCKKDNTDLGMAIALSGTILSLTGVVFKFVGKSKEIKAATIVDNYNPAVSYSGSHLGWSAGVKIRIN